LGGSGGLGDRYLNQRVLTTPIQDAWLIPAHPVGDRPQITACAMNTKLVKILAEIIRSLSEAERTLLFAELQPLPDWRETLKKMQELGDKISARHGGKPLEQSVDEIFQQMREERTKQLMQACFPDYQEK